MADPNFVLLYVESPARSAELYGALLGKAPVESSPTFVMFALESGVMLGLWAKHGVTPAATAPGGTELAFALASDDAVHQMHAEWKARGLRIVQEPVRLDFGFAVTALDPDGHRLRAFAPSSA